MGRMDWEVILHPISFSLSDDGDGDNGVEYERSTNPGRSKTVPVDANASGCNRDSCMSFSISEIPSRD